MPLQLIIISRELITLDEVRIKLVRIHTRIHTYLDSGHQILEVAGPSENRQKIIVVKQKSGLSRKATLLDMSTK